MNFDGSLTKVKVGKYGCLSEKGPLSHFIFIFWSPVLFGKSTPELNQNEPNSDKKTRMKWICRATSLKWICENDSSFYLINLSNSFLVGFHVCGSLIVHVCHQNAQRSVASTARELLYALDPYIHFREVDLHLVFLSEFGSFWVSSGVDFPKSTGPQKIKIKWLNKWGLRSYNFLCGWITIQKPSQVPTSSFETLTNYRSSVIKT